jgi:cell division protein FtsL
MLRWIPLWVVPVVLILSIGTIWLRLTMVKMTYRVSEMDRKITTLRHERERLTLELASLRSPRRLEKLARQSLKLSPPARNQVIFMRQSSRVSNPAEQEKSQ